MKTKEIDVWVSKRVLDGDDVSDTLTTYETGSVNRIKAKLVVEIPEKKVTITESQFDEFVNKWHFDDGANVRRDMKKELGFDND